MDNEVSEGLHLGVNLIVSIAIAVMLVTISGLTRTGYIYRERDIEYNNTVMERMVWQELNYYKLHLVYNDTYKTCTDTDSALKFVTDHCQDIHWIVLIQTDDINYNAYHNCSLTTVEKTNVEQKFDRGHLNWVYVNPLDITETNVMVDEIYSINSEHFINNQAVQNMVEIYACENKQTLTDINKIEFIQEFNQYYILPDLGIAIFYIR